MSSRLLIIDEEESDVAAESNLAFSKLDQFLFNFSLSGTKKSLESGM